MKKLITVFIFINLIFITSCYAARIDGPYEGKVIDDETGAPIEGVVILGTWSTETPTVAGAIHKYYDAQETVTDKNGEFKIEGLGLKVLSNVTPMNVLIFKSGYAYLGVMSWTALKRIGKNEGNKAIIRLKKLTMEQRKKQGSPDYPSEAPEKKIMLMLKEINKDRIERGLKPVN